MSVDATRALAERSLGKSLNGKYRLERVIGIGGMAVVYRAVHRNGHRVAIKMLLPECAREPELVSRFVKEGYAANAVEHDGVVRVDDDDVTEDGRVFVVMELLDGATLEEIRVERGGRLPKAMTLALGYQVLDVLVAAHAKGIIHRDIKPANLFLTCKGELKVLDFGIARFRNGSAPHTLSQMAMGTPDYAAPEQMFGRQDRVDGRADLYSVGATLYHLLTGSTPRCESVTARPLRELLPDAGPSLVTLIERALQDGRDDRWLNAEAMRQALLDAYAEVERGPFTTGPQLLEHMRNVSEAPAPTDPMGSMELVIPGSTPLPLDLAQSLLKPAAKLEEPRTSQPMVHDGPFRARGLGSKVSFLVLAGGLLVIAGLGAGMLILGERPEEPVGPVSSAAAAVSFAASAEPAVLSNMPPLLVVPSAFVISSVSSTPPAAAKPSGRRAPP